MKCSDELVTVIMDKINSLLEQWGIPDSTGKLETYKLNYDYDGAGNLTQMIYPDNQSVSYTYSTNSYGRLTSLTGPIVNGNNKIVPSLEYTTGGLLKAITFGNQAKTTFGLDNRGRTSKIHTVDETAQTIFNQVYAYDNVNNITSITDNIGGTTQSYSYDQLSRLVNAQYTNATNSQQNYQYQYGYDGVNNRTVLRDILNGTTESYAYHGSNSQLLTKVTKNGHSEDFTYNTAGAITRRTKNGVITNYSYDGAGRLIEVKVGSTIIAKYIYDPYGRLVKTTEGSTTTVRLPRGNETAYEKVTEQGMPTIERKYIIALGRYIARDEIIAGVTTRVFYHGDHLGSTRALSGEDSGSFTYDPFGNIVSATGDAEDHNHRFTGKPMDGTGLYYYGARFYEPTLGRFINMDPAKDGGNWWVYVNNNPLRYVDPDGLRPGGFVSEWNEEAVKFNWIRGFKNIFKSIFKKEIVNEDKEQGKVIDWNPILIPIRGEYLDVYIGELKLEIDVPASRTFQDGRYDKSIIRFDAQANLIKARRHFDTPILKLDISVQYGVGVGGEIGTRFMLTKPYLGWGHSLEIEPILTMPEHLLRPFFNSVEI